MSLPQMTEDALALLPSRGLSRRDFVRASVGTGFAAAVLPIAAQTVVKTSSDGLLAGEVTIPVGDFKMPAYRAVPLGKTRAPVVLVVSEIFGVHEHIADITRRFAHLGYCAIAPELFVRQGDVGAYGEISKLMSEVVSKVPDAQVMGDLDASVAWAQAQGMDTDRLGVTGFCWGGRITWLYAAHSSQVKAAVAWYGRLVGDTSALTPQQPIDLTTRLHAPVLGLYGGLDPSISQDSIGRMKAALDTGSAAAKASEFVVYPQASHAFNADYRTSYQPEAAHDGWQRCLAWLRRYGVS